ncbi:cuticle protein CP1499-like [Panulirus ornatus]|uniref:cuticle protein CP1499-like n=1 Tax=Panulirus ornatus TaxID=150431 RepID=UPI003A88F229
MRALVILAVLGVCSAFPFVQDAPDVAVEKANFHKVFQTIESAALAAVQAANERNPYQPKWYGPYAADLPASVPGALPQVIDTAEVAAARQAFFNTYKQQEAAVAPPSPAV